MLGVGESRASRNAGVGERIDSYQSTCRDSIYKLGKAQKRFLDEPESRESRIIYYSNSSFLNSIQGGKRMLLGPYLQMRTVFETRPDTRLVEIKKLREKSSGLE